MDEVIELALNNDVDILCLQETWIRKCDSAIIEEIKNYNLDVITERKPRRSDIGGGVAIIYKKELPIKRIKYKQYPSFESVSVIMKGFVSQTVITNLYYPGYSQKHRFTHNAFLDDLDDMLETELCNQENIVIGDYNIHSEDNTREETVKLRNILATRDLQLHGTAATHSLGGTIDLIIYNSSIAQNIYELEVINHVHISDHYPILFSYENKYQSPENKKITVRCQKFTDENITVINSLILESDDLKNINIHTIEHMVESYNATLSDICNRVSPVVVKIVKERTQQVWYTAELQKEKREKRKAERKYIKHRSEINGTDYKRLCDIYYTNVKETRCNYYANIISTKKDDMKAVYGIVNKLSGDGKINIIPKSKSDKELANDFAQFFTEKIVDIRKKITNDRNGWFVSLGSSIQIYRNQISPLNYFSPVTTEELNSIYNEMKKKNYVKDPIPVRAHIKCFESIRPSMLEIVNKSLLLGKVPQNLKHATVTPLIKDANGDHDDFKNYRPVHNTPLLAKVIEKCVLRQLNCHLHDHNLHVKSQSGYKKYHSCETAMIKVINDIQIEMQQNNITVVLMLDQSAAFDTVDIPILITKLQNDYNIHSDALKWLSSYLLGRTFSVVVNDEESNEVSMEYGVPQGTILAPLLYTMYTADLNKLVENLGLKIHSFADDNNIYMGFKPIDGFSQATLDLEACVKSIRKYMSDNYLKINIAKTQILFCGRPSTLSLYESRFDEFEHVLGMDCNRSDHGKTLGIKIDANLKFDIMIKETCRAGHFKLNKLKNVRQVLDVDIKLTLVKCFILSKIDYCNILLNQANKKQINPLQKLVNAAVRFVYNVRKSTNITSFMKKAHILPVNYRIKYKSSLYVFKILHGQAPPYVSELIHRKPVNRGGLRSSVDDTIVEATCGGQTIANVMCRTWNALPPALRSAATIATFKRNLKTHYFRIAFELI